MCTRKWCGIRMSHWVSISRWGQLYNKLKAASCIFCLRVHFANAISCRRMELFTECMNPHRSACDTQFYRLVQYSSFEKMGQYICEDKAGEGTMLIFPCLGTKLAHSLKTIKLCHSAGRALTCDWSVHSLPMFSKLILVMICTESLTEIKNIFK